MTNEEPEYECFLESADRGYEERRVNNYEPEITPVKQQWLDSVKAQIEETDRYLNEEK